MLVFFILFLKLTEKGRGDREERREEKDGERARRDPERKVRHCRGRRLSHDQTRYIFETNTIGVENAAVNVDDIVETSNHVR